MPANLSKKTKTVLSSTVFTTGTGNSAAGNAIDMAGFDGCMFFHLTGNTTSTVTLAVQGSTASGGSYQNLSGMSAATTVIGRVLIVDAYKPGFEFIKATINSTGAANVGGGVIGILYGGRQAPTTNASTNVAAETFGARKTT